MSLETILQIMREAAYKSNGWLTTREVHELVKAEGNKYYSRKLDVTAAKLRKLFDRRLLIRKKAGGRTFSYKYVGGI